MLLTHSVTQNSFANPNWWKILNFWISNDTFFLNTLWYLFSYLEPYLALRSAESWLKIQGGTFKTIQSRIKQKVMSKGRGKKRSFQKVFFSFCKLQIFYFKKCKGFSRYLLILSNSKLIIILPTLLDIPFWPDMTNLKHPVWYLNIIEKTSCTERLTLFLSLHVLFWKYVRKKSVQNHFCNQLLQDKVISRHYRTKK